jgi:(p)ppGpp synthase/HD superfamily hydrolase
VTSDDIRRDTAMEGRLARTLADLEVAPRDIALVVEAHRLAMEHRAQRLTDAHRPDFLHPGRTALILLLDTPYREAVGLAAATLIESEEPALRVPGETVSAALGRRVADFVAAVPVSGSDLGEALVTADPDVRLVALAERLDHCRHAKFWPDRERQHRIHEQALALYGPVAERTDATLARRFSHWSGAFGRTLR